MRNKLQWGIGVLLVAAFYLAGCSNGSNPVASASVSSGNVSMTAVYTSQAVAGLNKNGSVNAVDSIEISRVRVVLRNIRLKSSENEEVEMEGEDSSGHGSNSVRKLAPFVLDLNLTGAMQQISISNVPAGTYNRFKFQIHKVSQSDIDSLTAAEQATFADFLNGGSYSIIVDGTLFKNGQGTSFTYKSKIDVEIEKNLNPPLVIGQGSTNINLTLMVSSGGWFVDQANTLLDPTDPNNFSVIDNNLKNLLKAFKDNNKDGKEDKD